MIPLEAIREVAPLSEEERNKTYKKFFKNPMKSAFKVTFVSGRTSKRQDLVPEDNHQSMANLNIRDIEEAKQENDGDASARSRSMKGMTTWVFGLPEDQQKAKHSLKDWVSRSKPAMADHDSSVCCRSSIFPFLPSERTLSSS